MNPAYGVVFLIVVVVVSDHVMAEYIGAAKWYAFTTIPNRNIYCDVYT